MHEQLLTYVIRIRADVEHTIEQMDRQPVKLTIAQSKKFLVVEKRILSNLDQVAMLLAEARLGAALLPVLDLKKRFHAATGRIVRKITT